MSSKKPIRVEVRAKYPDEPIERMIKRFNKKVKKERIIEIFLEQKNYEKPSDRKRKLQKRRKKVLEKLHRAQQKDTSR
jgi:ribosomal protein S21|tara:strand:- start:260 stop:493 length:234 start_codon:yes stop_codon:yes gene_type:complete